MKSSSQGCPRPKIKWLSSVFSNDQEIKGWFWCVLIRSRSMHAHSYTHACNRSHSYIRSIVHLDPGRRWISNCDYPLLVHIHSNPSGLHTLATIHYSSDRVCVVFTQALHCVITSTTLNTAIRRSRARLFKHHWSQISSPTRLPHLNTPVQQMAAVLLMAVSLLLLLPWSQAGDVYTGPSLRHWHTNRSG